MNNAPERWQDGAMFVEGVWMPKGEEHLLKWMTNSKGSHRVKGKITYQWRKQQMGMELAEQYIKNWKQGIFVDIGAHCAFWSMWWAKKMSGVVAYEPIPFLRNLYLENMRGNQIDMALVKLLPWALTDAPDSPELLMRYNPHNTGDSRVYADGEAHTFDPIQVLAKRLDDTLPDALEGRRASVIKMDCEGFEEKVCRGGLEVIKDHKPMIIVEQKFEGRNFGFKKEGAVTFLQDHGYSRAKTISGDHYMIPPQ